MSIYYPELNQRILEMAEGDDEFRLELTSAIYNGLLELQKVYSVGRAEKNEVMIQQIRHKVKPTLAMFEFDQLSDSLQKGKMILEAEGFGEAFEIHYLDFLDKIKVALIEVSHLKN
ncbi:hypothetical protein [Algoriphagus sp. A40]|uniref:hypothetical protein n=1 Tax=Algoriphagus sp. A40 TaxID=1945863 RepID=UPI0009858B28|nr:hypothetical protein [Algoriphagus sp. A40]OOG73638.1 hypothetical protein B0E43_12310 [Algoriphagus sp. A40]